MVDKRTNDLSHRVWCTIFYGSVFVRVFIKPGMWWDTFCRILLLTLHVLQSFVTRILVPVFGALHALALFAFSLWFVAEQWRFRKTAGVGRKATAGSALMWLMERFDRMVHPMSNRYKDNHDVQTSYPRARDVTIDMDRMSDPATPKSRPETLSSSVLSSRASLETHETENTEHSLPPRVTTPVLAPTGQRCSSPILDSPTSVNGGDMFGIFVPENDNRDDVVPNATGPLLGALF